MVIIVPSCTELTNEKLSDNFFAPDNPIPRVLPVENPGAIAKSMSAMPAFIPKRNCDAFLFLDANNYFTTATVSGHVVQQLTRRYQQLRTFSVVHFNDF
ncbi:hypothetical protein [Pseudochryseolinea flava]|uniref:Uncharacterized protein n=1 Tax=Pseudochryseolinea flava TaxID=2059302 RepID=A0A364XWZ0_9BACT|nr:hypothetical protein [Pseudochryseolinea flava]RAV98900.1 hypothetical protein DQQ10_21610 [Pseudochryseolinea flava]